MFFTQYFRIVCLLVACTVLISSILIPTKLARNSVESSRNAIKEEMVNDYLTVLGFTSEENKILQNRNKNFVFHLLNTIKIK